LTRRFSQLIPAYGLMVVDGGGEVLFSRQPDRRMPAASLYKLGVAATVYAQVRAGRMAWSDQLTITPWTLAEGGDLFDSNDLGQTVRVDRAVEVMLIYSSNVAARLLLRQLRAWRVNAFMASLGLPQTRLLAVPLGGVGGDAYNQTTPREMAAFMRRLWQGEVVDRTASRSLLAILRQQAVRDRLPALLPTGVVIANKTGDLPGVVNDVGLISTPSGPLIVAALAAGVPNERLARRALAAVARTAYDAYSA
jgi:beta-lactamase class A